MSERKWAQPGTDEGRAAKWEGRLSRLEEGMKTLGSRYSARVRFLAEHYLRVTTLALWASFALSVALFAVVISLWGDRYPILGLLVILPIATVSGALLWTIAGSIGEFDRCTCDRCTGESDLR